ncbi:MAG: ABC transporter ATP-binding protein [Phycisphaeraceae bacterium]
MILQATNIHKTFRMGPERLHVLRGVDFSLKRAEWVAILGASGSGKSTLLHILGALDRPTEGGVLFQGDSIFDKTRIQQDQYRHDRVGFVFQQYHLLPELSLLDNVLISAMIGMSPWRWFAKRKAAKQRAMEVIESLGLQDRLKHRPNSLSGGERQRVAIARALVNQPDVLLADEPTGNLDAKTGAQILDVFKQIHARGQSIVMVTHDTRVADMADRKVLLESGRLK